MSDARLAGLPRPFEWEGRLFQVGACTFRAEAAFSLWMEREDYLALSRHRGAMLAEDYRQQLSAWRQDCGAKVYEFGGEQSYKALRSLAGLKHMVWLLVGFGAKGGGEVMELEDLDRLYDEHRLATDGLPADLPEGEVPVTKWAELRDLVYEAVFPNRAAPAAKGKG